MKIKNIQQNNSSLTSSLNNILHTIRDNKIIALAKSFFSSINFYLTKLDSRTAFGLAVCGTALLIGTLVYRHIFSFKEERVRRPMANKMEIAKTRIAKLNDEAVKAMKAEYRKSLCEIKQGVVPNLKGDLAKKATLEAIESCENEIENEQFLKKELMLKEMRDKKLVIGENAREIELLVQLGITIGEGSSYLDKDFLYKLSLEQIESKLSNNETITAESRAAIRTCIRQEAFKARLATVGFEGLKAEKFIALNEFDYSVKKSATDKAVNIPVPIPVKVIPLQHPKTIAHLKIILDLVKEDRIENYTKHFITAKFRKAFTDEKYALDKFKDKLNQKHDREVTNILTRILKAASLNNINFRNEAAFLDKWINDMQVEIYQGNDENGALGGGVCRAVNRRVAFASQVNPTLEPIELLKDGITPSDRFQQGCYKLNTLLHNQPTNEGTCIAGTLLYNAPHLENTIKCLMPTLQASKGWVDVKLTTTERYGHVVSLRLDAEKEKFWLLDANWGLFSFQNCDNCIACFTDLMQKFYSCYSKVTLYQSIKENASSI